MKRYVSYVIPEYFSWADFNLNTDQSNFPVYAFEGSPVDAVFGERDWYEQVEERPIPGKPVYWSLAEDASVFVADELTIDYLPTINKNGKQFFDYTELASEYDAIEIVSNSGVVGGLIGTAFVDWPLYEMVLVLNPDKIIFEETNDSGLSEFVSEKDRFFSRSKADAGIELVFTCYDHETDRTARMSFRSFDDALWHMSDRYHLIYRAHTEGHEAWSSQVVKDSSSIDLQNGTADILLSDGKRYHWEVRKRGC